MLNSEQRSRLLQVARQSVRAAVGVAPPPDLSADDPDLTRVQGAFVTLHKQGDLRGCIGHVEGHLPLIETVAEMAEAAALQDPRFPTVTAREEPALHIEISVMSPLSVVRDTNDIEVGRHGLVISSGLRRGLLLPQVATEWGWGRDEFLGHTCLKAGLPQDAWRTKDVRIESFEAEVFGEGDAQDG
jgi:AmmeMemoRadiSam system protein A